MGARETGRSDDRIVATNRKARHDYELLDTYECGIQLTGSEVKSLRQGQASLVDCYARLRGAELWLEGLHIPPYEQGDKRSHQPLRPRKLLLHRREIESIGHDMMEKSLSLVPLRVYFTHGIAKVEIALARGKRQHEKRQSIAKRDAQREAEQAIGRRRWRSPSRSVGDQPYTGGHNYIWGCTGFDPDVCRLGEAGRDPGCHVKRRTNTSANDEFALAA